MNVNLQRSVALALSSMTLIATGCSSLDARLTRSGEITGKAAAGITLPDQPDDCRKQEPHAAVTVGAELRSVLRRERGALDRANARVGRCAALWDDNKARLSAAPSLAAQQ